MVTNHFFFHSLHLPHLFIFSLTPSTKTLCLSFIPSQSNSHLFLQSHILSQTLSSPSIAPKSKKSSYILSTDALHLTRWNGVIRLAEDPPLTYKSQQLLFEDARVGSVSVFLFFFFHFQACPLIFRFDLFLGL